MDNNYYPFINLPLPYPYDAFMPYIDEKTMYLHHTRHLQAYIDGLNDILRGQPRLQAMPLNRLMRYTGSLPRSLRTNLHNMAGGVYNHRFYFDGLAQPAPLEPTSNIAHMITKSFGGLDEFRTQIKNAAMSVFGSGYAWLVLDKNILRIETSKNQDTPLHPILNIDVWEHAYYLKHYNMRSDYIDDWMYLINWPKVQQRTES